MMLKSKLTAFLGTALLAGSVYAGAKDNPTVCPSIGAIQSEGISMSYELAPNLYAGLSSSLFDTSENWIFLIGLIEAESEDEAIEVANQHLPTVTGNPEPEQDRGYWVCKYETGTDELGAMAIQSDEVIAPMQLKHFLK